MENQDINLLPLFNKFITESAKGKRLKKNGKRLKAETVDNYRYVLKNLQEFITDNNFEFRLRPYNKLDSRAKEAERNYWKRFYRKFTDYLYLKRNCHDNYVGSNIKVIRVFMNYLKNEKQISTGDFQKEFYIIKEEIPVITLSFEQLQFLIFDSNFKASLPHYLEQSLDIFILGCTVALRVSDIFRISPKDIEKIGEYYYLQNKSLKTETVTRVRLPDYAVKILKKYEKQRKNHRRVFPEISLNQFNKNIKTLAELAGWTYQIGKSRTIRGKQNELYPSGINESYRFCDLMSSHVMRRTAITTMLILGMPEPLVRKISGHSSNSAAFYRYVNYAQSFIDNEITKVHQKLEMRVIT